MTASFSALGLRVETDASTFAADPYFDEDATMWSTLVLRFLGWSAATTHKAGWCESTELIAACLAGRTSAFQELVTRYQDRLYNSVYWLIEHGEDARDIVQEAFLRAFQSLRTVKDDSRFFTGLYRIAVHAAMNHKRKQRVAHLRCGDEFADSPQSSEANRPEHAMELAEEEKCIREALNRLSPEHRLVLVMKDIDGQRYEDIAEILQVPIGTVRSRLQRARLEVRRILLEIQPDQRARQS